MKKIAAKSWHTSFCVCQKLFMLYLFVCFWSFFFFPVLLSIAFVILSGGGGGGGGSGKLKVSLTDKSLSNNDDNCECFGILMYV